MLKAILTSFLLFTMLSVSAQNGYYHKDSLSSFGAYLIDDGEIMNAKYCTEKLGKNIIRFTPYEVNTYSFNDGRIFIARDIQVSDSVQRVFLHRLVRGRVSLYYYRGDNLKTYFIEKDSSGLVELPFKDPITNKGFRDKLMDVTIDCPGLTDAVKLTAYNKYMLAELIGLYDQCKIRPFPFLKFGVITGIELVKLIPPLNAYSQYIREFDYQYNPGSTVGLFADLPLFNKDISLHTELLFSKHGFSYFRRFENIDVDYVANISSLKLPLMIRYTFPLNKFRPFINAGGVIVSHLKNKGEYYETSISESVVELNDFFKSSFISNLQYGFVLGTGAEYDLNYRNRFFVELRYAKNYGNSLSFKNEEIQLLTGINF